MWTIVPFLLTFMPIETVTFTALLNEDRQAELNKELDGEEPSVRLRVPISELPRSWSKKQEIRVFINNPDADGKTSTKDLTYFGKFTLADAGDAEFLLFDIAPTLIRLQQAEKFKVRDRLQITLVVIKRTD